ncbi:MAG: response regulator transcription factor [Caldilineales bacterium]
MPDQATQIRILVADDHPIVRDGLGAVLATQPDFLVVGQAGTGREVIEQVAALDPDIVLLDLEMPEMDGVQALQRLRILDRPVRAIAFTAFDTDERILSAVKAGAKGYLLKGAPREELFNAVRIVHAGGSLLQPVVASKLIQRVTEPPAAPLPEPLTPRELEVLELMAVGLQNKEIGDKLAITERTVKFHVSSILGKLDAGNRTEAVAVAVQQGLIER